MNSERKWTRAQHTVNHLNEHSLATINYSTNSHYDWVKILPSSLCARGFGAVHERRLTRLRAADPDVPALQTLHITSALACTPARTFYLIRQHWQRGVGQFVAASFDSTTNCELLYRPMFGFRP